jgi:hypothetical protein
MLEKWETHETWIAHFDILGFKSMVDNEGKSLQLASLKSKIDDVICKLEKEIANHEEFIDYQFYADTFIIYSKNDKVNDYPSLVRASKNFIINCIYKSLPVRGAISYGEVLFGHQKKIIIGKAFLEAYVYGEDQNWIGLILTPSASNQLKSHDLYPSRHGFINKDIPLRELDIESVFAYRYIDGSTNFECPLLPCLNEMQHFAPECEKQKYNNTIDFINKHYTVHKS